MIRAAFRPEYWNSAMIVKVDSNSNPASFVAPPGRLLLEDEFTLSNYNFPLFFGLAVQMYESTLVSNDTPRSLSQWHNFCLKRPAKARFRRLHKPRQMY